MLEVSDMNASLAILEGYISMVGRVSAAVKESHEGLGGPTKWAMRRR